MLWEGAESFSNDDEDLGCVEGLQLNSTWQTVAQFRNTYSWEYGRPTYLTADRLAGLVERRTVEREVRGSGFRALDRTNTQGLKNNWGEHAAFAMTSANG